MGKQIVDALQVIADNSDALAGRLAVPDWAKFADFWLSASDSDWLYSITVDAVEYVRNAAPNQVGADNLNGDLFNSNGFSSAPVRNGSNIIVNINVITAGVGIFAVRYHT